MPKFLDQWLKDSKTRGLGRRTLISVIHDDDCPRGMLGFACECDPVFFYRFVKAESR
jgi:hypothetical protein